MITKNAHLGFENSLLTGKLGPPVVLTNRKQENFDQIYAEASGVGYALIARNIVNRFSEREASERFVNTNPSLITQSLSVFG